MLGVTRETWISWAKTLVVAGLIAFAVRSFVRSSSGPSTGTAAADFSLASTGSTASVSLADLRGTPVLLEAMTSWCSVCQQAADAVNQAAQAPRDKPVQFVSVLLDSNPEAARALKASWGIQHELLIDDGSFSRSYSISMLPTFILLDSSGVVRKVFSGRPDRDDIEGWLSDIND